MEQLKATKHNLPIQEQIMKMIQEEGEVVDAWWDMDDAAKHGMINEYKDKRLHLLEEICDVQVAAETLKVHHFSKEEIENMHKFVNQKNKERGYL